MAAPRRISARAWAPWAALLARPLQHVQISSTSRIRTRAVVPLAAHPPRPREPLRRRAHCRARGARATWGADASGVAKGLARHGECKQVVLVHSKGQLLQSVVRQRKDRCLDRPGRHRARELSALLPGRDAISGGVRVAQRPACRPTPRARCVSLVCARARPASRSSVTRTFAPPPEEKQRGRLVVGVGGPPGSARRRRRVVLRGAAREVRGW